MDLDEGVALDDGPFLAIPLAQAPGPATLQEFLLVVRVIRDHDTVLGREGALEVLFGPGNLQLLAQVEEVRHFEAADIHLPEASFHTQEVDLVLRFFQMLARGAQPVILEPLNRANVAVDIDRVRPDERLPAGPVHEAVGKGAGQRH